jgi:hypothetical protein
MRARLQTPTFRTPQHAMKGHGCPAAFLPALLRVPSLPPTHTETTTTKKKGTLNKRNTRNLHTKTKKNQGKRQNEIKQTKKTSKQANGRP